MGKPLIQPLEMREFSGELATMLRVTEKIGTTFLPILQDEGSNRLLFVQKPGIRHGENNSANLTGNPRALTTL